MLRGKVWHNINSMKDYYQILGLQKGASRDEVKKAFRKLSTQFHPDKKTGDEAKYKEITEAYATLGDEKKKTEYDTYGHTMNGAGQAGGGLTGLTSNKAGEQTLNLISVTSLRTLVLVVRVKAPAVEIFQLTST